MKWDTAVMQDKVTLLQKASETLRALSGTYSDLQARIEENWSGAAAAVYLSELSIDIAAVGTLADNIDVLAKMLTRAVAVYATCTNEVSADMQSIEENLCGIK